jgi:succinyl-CoA synthetase beta subunit
MVGLGGIWTEALDDIRLMPADLSREQIAAEINRLKGARVLHGLRGAPPVDIMAIANVAGRIGALMRARPDITAIDINPLVAYPDGVLALDALIVTAD